MKLTFDFQGMKKLKAVGVAKHNERVKGFFEGNLLGNKPDGGIDPSKIKNNIILAKRKSFHDDEWLGDVKVAGGRQKTSQEFTGWVIQVGGTNNKEKKLDTLPLEENVRFLREAHQWIVKKYGEDSIMGSVIQLDETTPQLQIIMNNKTIDKKHGKIYLSSKRKFGFEGLTNRQVSLKSKELQNEFFDDVAKKYGIEAPSETLGTKGKVLLAQWKLEQKQKDLIKKQAEIAGSELNAKLYDVFAKNNEDKNAIALKLIQALDRYNPKLAKAAKAALIKKAKENISKK